MSIITAKHLHTHSAAREQASIQALYEWRHIRAPKRGTKKIEIPYKTYTPEAVAAFFSTNFQPTEAEILRYYQDIQQAHSLQERRFLAELAAYKDLRRAKKVLEERAKPLVAKKLVEAFEHQAQKVIASIPRIGGILRGMGLLTLSSLNTALTQDFPDYDGIPDETVLDFLGKFEEAVTSYCEASDISMD